ncbi:hypothetical protein JMI89_11600 [Frischella sp. Ac48]|uniref:hypothetical protein n=1 Tax=Frischella sp. Ac48 TaxID=2804531 RepID=UPI001C7D2E02|nr:hypothetical protein [Frischella sp. Ac48]MBX4134269.1 hypothetical protein [Frischella sp. Ac48]
MLENLPRITGAAQVASGIMNLYVAAAIGRVGVGAPLAAAIGFVALDNIQAGARSMWSNEVTPTHGGELIEWSGLVAKGYGEIAYTLIDIGLITKSSSVVKMATQTENVIKLDTTTAVKVGQTIKPTEVTISIDKISLNQKNVIELKEFNAGRGTAGSLQGKILGEYTAIKPVPLTDDLAGTFTGGKYKEVVLQQDTILYRAGTADKPFGQFFSVESPQGVLQTRIDKAVLPQWPGGGTSPIDSSIAIKIPAGTKVYVGEVGSQNGIYVGGTQQIVVPKSWTIKGIEIIEVKPLK